MRVRALSALLASGLLLAACGGADAADDAGDDGGGDGLSGTLTVFAAASVTDVFEVFGQQLEAENPALDVQLSVAGSAALAAQLEQGAPADVFASADEAQMERLVDARLVDDADDFARNPLMVAVPRGNPAGIAPPEGQAGIPSLVELLATDLTVAVCAPEVPCGAAAAEVLEAAGLADAPDTYENDVRAVLTKVQLGEVDAGLVYVSDVHAAEDSILAYAFSESAQAINTYLVGALTDAPNPAAARAFIDLVLSDAGQQALADAGFLPPS